jgi:hypothetical protein
MEQEQQRLVLVDSGHGFPYPVGQQLVFWDEDAVDHIETECLSVTPSTLGESGEDLQGRDPAQAVSISYWHPALPPSAVLPLEEIS